MIKTDSVICSEGLNALNEKLGLVDTERFFALLNRESFDYTVWRKELLKNETVDSLYEKAKAYSQSKAKM
jgi:hypothetical protein